MTDIIEFGSDSPIPDSATLAELRRMSPDAVVAALYPNMINAMTQRVGPFGSVAFRPMIFRGVGSVVEGHGHKFDHATLIAHGAVNCIAQEIDPVDGRDLIGRPIERQYKAPSVILIKKNWAHKFTCLVAPVWAVCIFAVRDHSGEVAEYWDGNEEFWR